MSPARGQNRHSKPTMIAALQRVAKKIGRTPMADWKGGPNAYPRHRLPTEATSAMVIALFGSWNAALEAAGLPLNTQPTARARRNGFGAKTYTDAELLAAVAAAIQPGKVLTCLGYEARRPDGSPCGALIRRRLRGSVGTWTDIVTAAGGRAGTPHYPRTEQGRRSA